MAVEELTGDDKRGHVNQIDSPFLCADEAANYLRITLRALENFRVTGEGPAYRKHGGRVVYHIHDLDRWSARRRFRSSSKRDAE